MPVFLPGKFHGQRRLAGYTSWGRKESDMTEQLSTHPGIISTAFIYLFIYWPFQAACRILVPQPGMEPRPMAVKAGSPNHWAAREFPCCYNSTAFSEPRVIPGQGVHQLYCSDQAKAGAGTGLCKGRTAEEAHEAILRDWFYLVKDEEPLSVSKLGPPRHPRKSSPDTETTATPPPHPAP